MYESFVNEAPARDLARILARTMRDLVYCAQWGSGVYTVELTYPRGNPLKVVGYDGRRKKH